MGKPTYWSVCVMKFNARICIILCVLIVALLPALASAQTLVLVSGTGTLSVWIYNDTTIKSPESCRLRWLLESRGSFNGYCINMVFTYPGSLRVWCCVDIQRSDTGRIEYR